MFKDWSHVTCVSKQRMQTFSATWMCSSASKPDWNICSNCFSSFSWNCFDSFFRSLYHSGALKLSGAYGGVIATLCWRWIRCTCPAGELRKMRRQVCFPRVCLLDRLIDCIRFDLADWLIDWLIDRLTSWLVRLIIDKCFMHYKRTARISNKRHKKEKK